MEKVKLLIIGAGPGGYVAAIRAAQLGLDPVVIEKSELGGTCLNWGCIPTKALIAATEALESAKSASAFGIKADPTFDWKEVVDHARNTVVKNRMGVEFLFKKNKIRLVKGEAKFTGDRTVTVAENEFEADNIIIATGSRVRNLPHIEVDGKDIVGSDEALFFDTLPKSIAILGGGVIGCEFAYIFNAFGSEVQIVEAMDRIIPFEDKDSSKELQKEFKKKKIKIHTKTFVEKVEKVGGKMVLTTAAGKTIEADTLLSAIGRSPNTEKIGLENTGITTDEKGFIKVDENLETSVKGVYAIGDIIATPMLAHTAEHEGISVVESLAGIEHHAIDYNLNPGCIYCQPSIASVGYTEDAAKEKGIEVKIGKFPFTANGKAVASNHTKGFVKVIIDAEDHKLLGVHIVGHAATDLISEFLPAMSMGAKAEDIVSAIHPHPTLSEASLEAVLDALGRALHI